MTLAEAKDKYMEHGVITQLSKKTLQSYEMVVSKLCEYFCVDTEVNDLTHEDVEKYILHLKESPRSKATMASYIRTIKCFFNYLKKYFDIPMKVALIQVPKCRPKLVNILDCEEMSLLAEAVVAEKEWLTIRNKLIVLMMYDSGLRQNEVCNLLWKNIFADSTMKVLGKGGKERIVPIGNTTMKYLKRYKSLCPFAEEYVFVERRGERLTPNAIKLFMQKVKKKVPFCISSHRLRHNFATNYCLNQYRKYGHMDPMKLMAIMGHEDLKTTMGYIHEAENIIASRESISHMDNIIASCTGWTL